MSEYTLQREEAARAKILKHLPTFCGGCMQEGGRTVAMEPAALDACYNRLVREEIAGKRPRHGCVITEVPI
jgi:hypothetical protein